MSVPFRTALLALALVACRAGQADDAPVPAPPPSGQTATAVFAGGCFWCMEKPFDAVEGVISTTSGYAGGTVEAPTYEQVSSGTTGHAEAMQVVYDPEKVTYAQLLEVYWHNVDPLDAGGQFCDRGSQYRSAIFPGDAEQRRLAESSKAEVDAKLAGDVVTTIETADRFWPAEGYHQDYYLTHPVRYAYYRKACGRDARLAEVWGEAATH